MKHIFVLNPVAGDGLVQSELVPAIERLIAKYELDAEVYLTKAKGDAKLFVRERCLKLRQAGFAGELRFYAGGGDGTLGEVAGGVLGDANASVCCLPYGTGNDFIRNFGEDADFRDPEAQLSFEPQTIDLLMVNGEVCVNVCNMGFDALVAHNVTVMKRKLGLRGHAAYYASVLYCLFKKLGNRLCITVDGDVVANEQILLAAACNGVFYGGGFKSAPSARPDDGLIDLCIVRTLPRSRIARLVNLYKAGKHLQEPSLAPLLIYQKCRKVTVESDEAFIMARDGETEALKKVEIELIPQAWRFCLPKK